MTVQRHETPYVGSPHDIVGEHRELSGRTRIGSRWFRTVVQHEMLTIVTVDTEPSKHAMDLHQYVQKREWI